MLLASRPLSSFPSSSKVEELSERVGNEKGHLATRSYTQVKKDCALVPCATFEQTIRISTRTGKIHKVLRVSSSPYEIDN
ncbi:hypothetical protein VTO42DRAFT_1361 [Malbranchea cinnamomea]